MQRPLEAQDLAHDIREAEHVRLRRRDVDLRGAAAAEHAPAADTRVMIVDQERMFCDGLARLLRGAGLDVVGEAHAATQAAALAGTVVPDVILMSLDVPGASAVDLVRVLGRAAPAARVVLLTVAADHDDVFGALAAGGCACIFKAAPLHEVVAAVRAAAEGESVISPAIASRLIGRLRVQEARAAEGAELSAREIEVLRLLARGWSNARIAQSLYVSQGTVKHHISNILVKLEVDNRIQAAVRAVERGLLDA
jgi:DNA-binding NarL/FixJ family response regulator